MRVIYWGTYDTGKPRNRIMIRGLTEHGVDVLECHADIWKGIEDKSQIHSWADRLCMLIKWLSSYPALIWRYFRLPKYDAVVIGYIGHLDILVLWPFARLRGMPIIWDAFISLYNTVVEDRRLIGSKHPLSRFLFTWERLACMAADLVILDTKAHGRYFVETFRLPPEKVDRVFVGAETDVFKPDHWKEDTRDRNSKSTEPFMVLFYGQFIPLHGVETVVKAAKLADDNNIHWVLIGKGQESPKILDLIEQLKLSNLEHIDWLPYEELINQIHSADVCLGIFGNTDKAKRVIPNKAFQILAAGRPLITADTPAIREWLSPSQAICLVPVNDPDALASAVKGMRERTQNRDTSKDNRLAFAVGPEYVGRQFASILQRVLYVEKR